MSDATARGEFGHVGRGLTSSAKPFVPTLGDGGKPSLTSTSSAVYAAPFVPSSSASQTSQRLSATSRRGADGTTTQLSSRAATAAPFVPGGQQTSNAGPSLGRGALMSSSAMPFMPKDPSFSPRGRSVANGSLGRPAGELQLPDGDDLLGMTAHTPAGVSQAQSPVRVLSVPVAQGLAGTLPAPQASARHHRTSSPLRHFANHRGPAQHAASAASALPGRGRGAPQAWRTPPPVGRGRTPLDQGRGRGGRRPLQMLPVQAIPVQPATQNIQQMAPPYSMELYNTASAAGYWAERLGADEQQRSYLVMQQGGEEWKLPEMVQQYHSLCPLEDLTSAREKPSRAFGIKTALLKGVSSTDGQAYTLRRIDNRRFPADTDIAAAAQDVVQQWFPLVSHPNLATPAEAFVTAQLEGGPALVLVHAYYPAAITLDQAHMHQAAGGSQSQPAEEVLWSYMVQLTSAARAAHSAGLLLRPQSLMPCKVILTSPRRIRVGSLGVADLMAEDISSHEELHALQREDLTAIGRLLLILACSSTAPSLDTVAATYSQGFVRALSALLASAQGTSFSSWQQVAALIAEHMLTEVDAHQLASDAAAAQVWRGAEDGRLLRILVRLTSILERPNSEGDLQWAETGDLYLLKLYRDFVLHQTKEDGTPNLDWGHLVESLNKLDAGLQEKITLMSRDEASMLLVSYADLKSCLESAYNELRSLSTGARLAPRLDMKRRL